MKNSVIFVFVALVALTVRAQIPSLGFCPEYLPMAGFNMSKFAGIWYEAERYFQLSEVASRCVTANYTKGPDGKFHVTNEITSRFTGIKRVLEGEIRKPPSKAEEGKLHVKFSTVPFLPLETQYIVLETDYDNYSVMWSCSGLGPVNTQNAWIMTRQRIPSGDILQKAYGVLDKYKISKVFFVKTNQDDCLYLDTLHSDQLAAAANPSTEPPKQAEDQEYEEYQPIKKSYLRENVVPDAPENLLQIRKAEIEAQERAAAKKAESLIVPQSAVVVEPLQPKITEHVKQVVQEPEPLTRKDPQVVVEKAKESAPIAEVIKAEI